MAEQTALKSTALTDVHIGLGAKMVPFAGFNMPVLYNNLIQEHLAVRNSVGVFDVSHMGEFFIEGPNAYTLVEYITSNDVSTLTDGRVQYSCLPNENGGIVDDLLVYRFDSEKYMLVVNASNIEKDLNWILKHNAGFGAIITNRSDEYSLLAVQGPNAEKTVQKLTDTDLSLTPYYHFVTGTVAGISDIIISNTGYTGAGGFELYVKNENARQLWDALFEVGQEFDIQPIGLGARDTLRLEKGFCLYGNDIDDTTSPIEAGLGWITKFTQPFVHADYHRALKDNKPKRKLVAFELTDRGIPRQHYPVCDSNGNSIGIVTSGTMSPSLNKPIGLAYVSTEFSKADTVIYIEIRGKLIAGKVVKLPFL